MTPIRISQTSTNGHLSTLSLFYVHVYGQFSHSYFILSAMATSPQQQQPLKCVLSAKITFRQLPVNQRVKSDVYTYIGKGSETRSCSAHRWSLFLFY